MATLQVPKIVTPHSNTLRTRSPKSTRGRPRRPPPPPPRTLRDRIKAAKRSPYFVPLLVLGLTLLGTLIASAVRIASSQANIVDRIPTSFTASSSPSVTRTPASPSLVARAREEMAAEAGRVAQEALEKAWDLRGEGSGAEDAFLPVEETAGAGQGSDGDAGGSGGGGEPVEVKPRTMEELKAAMAGFDTDELTRMLNSAYRGEEER